MKNRSNALGLPKKGHRTKGGAGLLGESPTPEPAVAGAVDEPSAAPQCQEAIDLAAAPGVDMYKPGKHLPESTKQFIMAAMQAVHQASMEEIQSLDRRVSEALRSYSPEVRFQEMDCHIEK